MAAPTIHAGLGRKERDVIDQLLIFFVKPRFTAYLYTSLTERCDKELYVMWMTGTLRITWEYREDENRWQDRSAAM